MKCVSEPIRGDRILLIKQNIARQQHTVCLPVQTGRYCLACADMNNDCFGTHPRIVCWHGVACSSFLISPGETGLKAQGHKE
jgi:hypothetical protein